MSTHIKLNRTLSDGSKTVILLPKSSTRFFLYQGDPKVSVACDTFSCVVDESIEEIEALLNG